VCDACAYRSVFAGGSHVALRRVLRKGLFASAAGVIALMLGGSIRPSAPPRPAAGSISTSPPRRVSTSPFQALEPAVLRLQGNVDATGQGGVCTGDSGSPRLLNVAGHDVAVAIVSTGDGHFCGGANPNFNYRLDTPSARAFLSQFVT